MLVSLDLAGARRLLDRFSGDGSSAASCSPYRLETFNSFKLNLVGARMVLRPDYRDGRVLQVECYERGGRILPNTGIYQNMMRALKFSSEGRKMFHALVQSITAQVEPAARAQALSDHMLTLEAMIDSGWVTARQDKKLPPMPGTDKGGRSLRSTEEGLKAIGSAAGREGKSA